jgi:hypothetical protein
VQIFEISPQSAPGVDRVSIGSGLAAEVFITTGDHSFLDYHLATDAEPVAPGKLKISNLQLRLRL